GRRQTLPAQPPRRWRQGVTLCRFQPLTPPFDLPRMRPLSELCPNHSICKMSWAACASAATFFLRRPLGGRQAQQGSGVVTFVLTYVSTSVTHAKARSCEGVSRDDP